MKFPALLLKEFRECLPWLLLAGIIFLTIGGFALRAEVYSKPYHWNIADFSPGKVVNTWPLTQSSHLALTGIWLFFASIGLGLMLGIRQFWVANFTKTWGFLLHRSAGRGTILSSKLAAALIGFLISLGVVWICLYKYACIPELVMMPPGLRVFIEGWIFISIGYVIYLGTALSGLSRAKWYTTKMFGLGYAILAVITAFQWSIVMAFVMIAIGVVILLTQIFSSFFNREF
ncbi:hypothetical protein ACFL3G_09070 [Planctomycetota bacterium]